MFMVGVYIYQHMIDLDHARADQIKRSAHKLGGAGVLLLVIVGIQSTIGGVLSSDGSLYVTAGGAVVCIGAATIIRWLAYEAKTTPRSIR